MKINYSYFKDVKVPDDCFQDFQMEGKSFFRGNYKTF